MNEFKGIFFSRLFQIDLLYFIDSSYGIFQRNKIETTRKKFPTINLQNGACARSQHIICFNSDLFGCFPHTHTNASINEANRIEF